MEQNSLDLPKKQTLLSSLANIEKRVGELEHLESLAKDIFTALTRPSSVREKSVPGDEEICYDEEKSLAEMFNLSSERLSNSYHTIQEVLNKILEEIQ